MPSGVRSATFGIERHQRIDADQQVDAAFEQQRGMHRAAQRAVDEMPAAHFHRRIQAGQRGAGLHAREIGTSSQSSPPKRTALPLSSSTATTYSGAASSRKSLLRPRRVNTSRRKRSISALSNKPGRHQPAEAGDRIRPARIAAAEQHVAPPFHRQARQRSRRGACIRRRPGAGRFRGGTARRRCRR